MVTIWKFFYTWFAVREEIWKRCIKYDKLLAVLFLHVAAIGWNPHLRRGFAELLSKDGEGWDEDDMKPLDLVEDDDDGLPVL